MSKRQSPTPPAPSALDDLLGAEREIAAGAARVAAECAALVDAARADAAEIERASAETLERDLAALRADAARERARVAGEIASSAAVTIERYASLPDAGVDRLAEFIAVRVTGLGAPPSGGGAHADTVVPAGDAAE